MVIGGQQAAQHASGERAAEGILRGIAYSRKLAVLVSCAAKLGRCVLRRGIFRSFSVFFVSAAGAQIVERERRALIPRRINGARRPAVLAAVTQDIKVKQRSVAVTDRDQLVKCIAPRHAQLALGQQHRGHRLVLPFRRFFFLHSIIAQFPVF